jgi:hypothetical protein
MLEGYFAKDGVERVRCCLKVPQVISSALQKEHQSLSAVWAKTLAIDSADALPRNA